MKPGRPFGLTLAILTGVVVFVVIPLAQVVFVWSFTDLIVRDEGGGLAGVVFSGVPLTPLLIQAGASLLFLLAAVLAWFGKPRGARWFFLGMILLYGGGLLALQILPGLLNPPTIQSGVDSGDPARQTLLTVYMLVVLLLMMYSSWFLNRWSVRAFFRGYYTRQDKTRLHEMGALYE